MCTLCNKSINKVTSLKAPPRARLQVDDNCHSKTIRHLVLRFKAKISQDARALVVGDSHVRRINEFMPLIDSNLRQGYVTVDLKFRGGAGLSFAEERIRRALG